VSELDVARANVRNCHRSSIPGGPARPRREHEHAPSVEEIRRMKPTLVSFAVSLLVPAVALAQTAFSPNHLFVSNAGAAIFEFAQDGSFVRSIPVTGTVTP